MVPMEFSRLRIDGDALVVTFDMCSSTTMVEELTLCGALSRYDELVTAVKEHLAAAQKEVRFEPYKFSGDGWILLFPIPVNGDLVFRCLQNLFYEMAAERLVCAIFLLDRPSQDLRLEAKRGRCA